MELCNSLDMGITLVYILSGQSWPWQATLGHTNDGQEFFGNQVALSGDGNTLIVGNTMADVNGAESAGVAFVFVRYGGGWTQQARLTASDGVSADWFGASVALNQDGNTAVVGATGAAIGGRSNQGAAYVFTRSNGVWTQQAKLTAANGKAEDWLGYSAALSANGSTALIGAHFADPSGHTDQGAVYIFSRSGSSWSQYTYLSAGQAEFQFGETVAMSADSNTLLIGASNADVDGKDKQGLAYVFVYNGSQYVQQTILKDTQGLAYDSFGSDVALSDDGNTALIGARGAKVGANEDQGVAFVYTRSGSTWTPRPKLTAGGAGELFGQRAALNGAGTLALIGSPKAGSKGAAYIFALVGQDWVLQKTLLASNGAADDFFGRDLVLSKDGGTAFVGAAHANWGGMDNPGLVYVFQGPFSGHRLFLPVARRN